MGLAVKRMREVEAILGTVVRWFKRYQMGNPSIKYVP
jgi:ketopantoate reductase